MPTIGEQAPDFELLNQNGQPVKLSDFRGKRVVMFAYPKAGTPGCTTQACGFRDVFPKIEAGNAVVLGLSPDKPADLLKWKQTENLPYDLLSDPSHAVLEAWGAWGERSMYGRKFMGIIRSHWVIDENGVVQDEQVKVSPQDSVERAVKALGG
ncbi:MAG: thioredoxin-dependent thiol peroxidase [Anaerolineae bacterium]|nr:thioredoxin-dependent thiol peroxidase [Anaerolineae bacterium]